MQSQIDQLKYTLSDMGLNEYQAATLAHLLFLGETKATTLSKASGVPSARIYGVLEELSQKGFVIVKPGRPALYSPMSPEEVSDALIADARQEIRIRLTSIESRKEEFLSLAKEIYNQGGRVKSRPPLLRIVSVGDTSLEETKKLYAMARSTIYILTRAFEYYPQVSRELLEASERGVTIKTLMRSRESLSVEDGEKRDQIVSSILVSFKDDITIKVSDEVPIRGCIIDPEEEGSSLFLVEEQGVPFVFREAAITSHPGVVRGLMSLFDLKWRFDSDSLDYRG